jgi:hypothetical protein
MKRRALLGAGLIMLAAVSFAATTACEILLPQATQAGATTLAPGQYRVELEGSQAVFTNVMTGRSFAASVKVATTRNHQESAIAVDRRGGIRILKFIELRNSDQTLEFE